MEMNRKCGPRPSGLIFHIGSFCPSPAVAPGAQLRGAASCSSQRLLVEAPPNSCSYVLKPFQRTLAFGGPTGGPSGKRPATHASIFYITWLDTLRTALVCQGPGPCQTFYGQLRRPQEFVQSCSKTSGHSLGSKQICAAPQTSFCVPGREDTDDFIPLNPSRALLTHCPSLKLQLGLVSSLNWPNFRMKRLRSPKYT